MSISLGRIFAISVATVGLTVFALTAQAQMKETKPAACSTIKDDGVCIARADCSWSAEAKDKKGKVTKKAACKAKPKAKGK